MATKTETKTTYRKIKNTNAEVLSGDQLGGILKIVEERKFYSFRNTLGGPFVFANEEGKTKTIEGKSVHRKVTEEEAEYIRSCDAFQQGTIVEETTVLPKDHEFNPNSLNEKQIVKLFKRHNPSESEYWKEYIENLDSKYAIERLRDQMGKKDFPSSLISYCDAKLAEIEEEYMKEMEEPIEAPPEGV